MPRTSLALFLIMTAACGASSSGGTVPSAELTAAVMPLDSTVVQVFAEFVELPSDPALETIIAETAASSDVRWVPYLVDLLRFTNDARLIAPLAKLTGVAAASEGVIPAYTSFGRFMLSEAIDPGPEYAEWKANLYSTIDPEFRELLSRFDDPAVLAALQWGGVPVGGVPELNRPARLVAPDASYLDEDDLVFGAFVENSAVAYPLRILDVHELANDAVGGSPVVLANCTLCRSGALFSRFLDGQRLDFLTSGLLLNSNKLMLDLQTGTLWQQLTGEAIGGPLAGSTLERLPLTVTTWGSWRAEHPDTEVLALPAFDAGRGIEGGPSYESGSAYADYYGSSDLWFPALEVPGIFEEKVPVATIVRGGTALAVELAALAEAGPITLALGPERIIVVPTEAGARFYLGRVDDLEGAVAGEDALLTSGETYPRLPSGQSFWFAWFGRFPETAWWPDSGS